MGTVHISTPPLNPRSERREAELKTVLIVEDDILTAELERDYLEAEGFAVELCHDGAEGMRRALEDAYDLLILDVMLPSVNGFDICREARKQRNEPIIMVTARQEDVDKIQGLGLGADDYVVKPFSPSELVARVKAHIAIHERLLDGAAVQRDSLDVIEAKDLQISTSQHRVTVHGQEVALTNKEFELLCYLASNPGIVLSKDELFERVWGMDSNGDTATVTVHVNRLREKIERDPAAPEYIQTVWGAGYRFASRK